MENIYLKITTHPLRWVCGLAWWVPIAYRLVGVPWPIVGVFHLALGVLAGRIHGFHLPGTLSFSGDGGALFSGSVKGSFIV
jgi:hypothetical protein